MKVSPIREYLAAHPEGATVTQISVALHRAEASVMGSLSWLEGTGVARPDPKARYKTKAIWKLTGKRIPGVQRKVKEIARRLGPPISYRGTENLAAMQLICAARLVCGRAPEWVQEPEAGAGVVSDTIYREVTLTGPDAWQRVIDAVKPNAQSAIDRGHPLHIVITSLDSDRTEEQVAFYFGVVLARIAENIPEEDGELRAAAYWHEKLALQYLPMRETRSERTGHIHRARGSVGRGQITVGAMTTYITQCQAWAANLGIDWD